MSEQESAGATPGDVYAEDEDSPEEAAETSTATAAAAPPKNQPLFSDAEIAQFDADDVTAGSHIGKMLAVFFLYTVLAMSFVAWWTFRAVG